MVDMKLSTHGICKTTTRYGNEGHTHALHSDQVIREDPAVRSSCVRGRGTETSAEVLVLSLPRRPLCQKLQQMLTPSPPLPALPHIHQSYWRFPATPQLLVDAALDAAQLTRRARPRVVKVFWRK
jgi:hypothetical protein